MDIQQQGQFVRHESCDECGSSDGKAVYDNDTCYCFACNTYSRLSGSQYTHKVKEIVTLTSNVEYEQWVKRWQEGCSASIPERNILSAYVKKYGAVVSDATHAYPYFKDDEVQPIGFKVRDVATKGFRVVGDVKEAGLFGQNKYGNHNQRRIVVTEGELDALAACQMFEGKAAVVSLKTGAAGAARDFKAAYSFLDGFEEIVLCFDADDAGKQAIEKAAEVFAGKLRVMKLDPRVGKDACDYLRAGKLKEFTDAYWSASQYVPKGVLSKDELLNKLLAPRPKQMGEYPWAALNALTYGFRPTELITITAGSGQGKTAVLREVVMHIKQTSDARIGCLFMEESVERTAEGFMSVDMDTPLHLPTSPVKRGSQAYLDSFDRVYGDDRLYIMDASFDTGATVDEVVGRVRFMAKALDCKVIVLDHISILVSGGQHNDERKALDEVMTKLRTLTQDTGIVLFAVSHLKRPDGKGHEEGAVTSVSQLRGSASIAQLSDFVIGLERNGQAEDPTERNTTQIRVLKNRFSGLTGPAGHVLYDQTTGRLSEYEPIEAEEEAL